jgi:hypothetical protein
MKNNKFTVTLFLIILFALPSRTIGQNKTLSFDLKNIERKEIKIKGNVYEKIVMKKAFHSYDAGKPDLPVFYYKFYVPKGKKATNVTFIRNGESEFLLNSDLVPAQIAKVISYTGNDTLFDKPDPTIYGKNSFYPENQAKVMRSDFIDGDMEVITVAVYPMQYNPKQKKIIMATYGVLSLTTSSKISDHSNIFEGHSNRSETASLIKSMVENPEDVTVNKGLTTEKLKSNNLKSAQVAWSVPFYEYVIITSRSLKPAFNQFLTWKKRKGYNAGIVCIEDIVKDNAATGDPGDRFSPVLTDSAGKLRQYLKAGYNNPNPKTKYALLGGDYNVVPIRYGKGGSDAEWYNGTGKIPSDLYFSDFNSWWLINGETTFTGQDYIGFDYGPEIYAGRLLCNTEADIKTWTTKVLQYEQKPGNENYSYLSKALFTEADSIGYTAGNGGPIYIFDLPPMFSTKNCWKELPSENSFQPYFPTGSNVISELNTNYGLYCIFNHGNPNSFATATSGLNLGYSPLWRYQVTSSDNFTSTNITPENGNGFDNLTNFNFPTIVYSVSCINMPFDDYYFWGVNQKIPAGSRTLGTSFTVAYRGGGPSYIGYTRDSRTGPANELFLMFFDSITSFPQLGIAEAKSKIGYFGHWNKLALNLLGCPETELWTATPTTFSGASVTENGSSITVTTGGVSGSKICLMSALDNGTSYFDTISNVTSRIFTNVPKPYYVTIDKKNKIPYLKNPTTVLIENKTFSSLTYLNCQTVSAGYSVDPGNSPDGNVVIANGANVTFDATGDILLAGGFEVQVGATFEAK